LGPILFLVASLLATAAASSEVAAAGDTSVEVPAPFREARAPLVLDATLLCLAMPVLAMPAANEVILVLCLLFLCLFGFFLSFPIGILRPKKEWRCFRQVYAL
jgi:hypothetical protein